MAGGPEIDAKAAKAFLSAINKPSSQPLADVIDSWVLRNGWPQTPPGPEGSNGSDSTHVPQGCLAINSFRKRLIR